MLSEKGFKRYSNEIYWQICVVLSFFCRIFCDEQQFYKQSYFFPPNLRLRACLAMCLNFWRFEPEVAYKPVAYKKKKCSCLDRYPRQFLAAHFKFWRYLYSVSQHHLPTHFYSSADQ